MSKYILKIDQDLQLAYAKKELLVKAIKYYYLDLKIDSNYKSKLNIDVANRNKEIIIQAINECKKSLENVLVEIEILNLLKTIKDGLR